MVKKLFLFAAVLVAVFAAAHCNNDDNIITGPPILTATPTTGPGTPTVTPAPPTMTPTVGGPTQTPTPGAATMVVDVGTGGGMTFVDRTSGTNVTTIHAGDTVQWNWLGGPHSSTSGTCAGACTADGNWDSGLMTSGTFNHTFPAAGTFPYFCQVHGSLMTGTVVVQ
jgi:plastocyanin